MLLRNRQHYIGLDPVGEGGLFARALVPVLSSRADSEVYTLQALYEVSERFSLLAEGVQSAFTRYKELSYLRKPLKFSYILTLSIVLVLSLLADSEPLSPNHIADHLIISRASVTSLLDSLEKRGYARRRPHPTDRRMIWVEPTDLGRQIADEFRPIVHRQQKAWLGVLSKKEQEQLVEMLHRVQSALLEQDTE